MTPRLILICHASTAALRAARFAGDEPLDERGFAAARQLADGIKAPGRAWTSPLLRCRQTAEAMGIEAISVEALRECDYGSWAGKSLDAVAREEPEGLAAWLRDPLAAPHGGESLAALARRVAGWLDSVAIGKQTVAVTHASVMRVALLHVFRAPLEAFWSIEAEPLAIADLRSGPRGWRLHLGARPS